MAGERSILTGVKRGFTLRCPNCGEGRLFRGYLKLRSPCESCGLDLTVYPSDDFPPYLTILVAGHVLLPLFLWSDHTWEPPLWVQAAIWLPLTALACVVLLPFMKGATVGLCWANNLLRQSSST